MFNKKKRMLQEARKVILNASSGLIFGEPITTEEGFYDFLEKEKENQLLDSVLARVPVDSPLLNKKEIVIAAVRFNGLDLQYVTGMLRRDPQVIEAAINSNPLAIQYVENPTEKQIKMAVEKNYFALTYINDSFITDEANRDFFLNIVRKNGHALGKLPNYASDIEFIKVALINTPEAIQYIKGDIPSELIIDTFTRIKSKIEENRKAFRSQTNDVFKFYGMYHNSLMEIFTIARHVRENMPKHFDDSNFMVKLVGIEPELFKFATPKVQANIEFLDATRDYAPLSMFEMFDTYSEKSK